MCNYLLLMAVLNYDGSNKKYPTKINEPADGHIRTYLPVSFCQQ